MEENNTDNYIPGVCNIGKEERIRRRQTGIIGLIITIITFTLFVYFDVNKRNSFPCFFIRCNVSASGFLQSRMHFCVGFGLAEMFNFGNVGKNQQSRG